MSHILIIDDDEQIRSLIREVMEGDGHEVSEAPDGAAGTRSFREITPDLVITDIIMPDKDGLETIAEIRELDPKVRIVAISGGGRQVDRDYLPAAKAFGADRVLYKPFRPRDVRTAVRELLAD